MTHAEEERAYEYVKHYDEDNIEVSNNILDTTFSEAAGGFWVSAWVWVPREVVRGE